MYLRPEVEVSDWGFVEQFLADHPLGLLTTAIAVPGQPTIQASHVPFLFSPPPQHPTKNAKWTSTGGTWSRDGGNDLGVLRCHLARANPQAKALLSASSSDEVLVVFSDPINQAGYISPQWYIETKPAIAKTVPTWNYSELQIYGHARIVPTEQVVEDLSDLHEHRLVEANPKSHVWKVSDAPEAYIKRLHAAIVGIEITITSVACKLKMSRDKNDTDRQGVVDGLKGVGNDAADKIADTVQRLGAFKKSS
jgi:transcriptional regulator